MMFTGLQPGADYHQFCPNKNSFLLRFLLKIKLCATLLSTLSLSKSYCRRCCDYKIHQAAVYVLCKWLAWKWQNICRRVLGKGNYCCRLKSTVYVLVMHVKRKVVSRDFNWQVNISFSESVIYDAGSDVARHEKWRVC